MKKNILLFLAIILSGCNTTSTERVSDTAPEMTVSTGNNVVSALVAEEASAEVYELISKAKSAVNAGRTANVIETYINPIISDFEKKYKSKYSTMYSPRTAQENMIYTLEGLSINAVEGNTKQITNIYRVPYVFAEAYFLKGYLYVSLGNLDLGEKALEEALLLAPRNSLFLSELGHISQAKQDFDKALTIFEKAVLGANFSPEVQKDFEKGRALRGVGFSLIELNRLDEAEEKFNQALEINPDDAGALHELRYIKSLRDKNT